ncbi:MAG: alpha/beta hydrolase [Kiritimatiellae bacterium]|nr:alpha/beta hydrolase [Kiritimatiellia bacterium]
MKRVVVLLALLGSGLLWASFGPLTPSAMPCEREYIWPDGKMPDSQAHQIAAKTEEAKASGFKADDFRRPYLEWYAPNPTNKTDLCVLVISGGGFNCCCDAKRLQPAIDRFVDAGITVANLTYRTPRPKDLPVHQSAWEDAQRAVRVVRSQAVKRGFDPEKIGGTGISAGAKTLLLLATSALTPAYAPVDELDQLPCHLLFAIPQAPAYVLSDGNGTPNAREGDAPDVTLLPELKFDAKTCPMCLFQGGLDEYSPLSSTQIYRQLRRMKIPAEVHIFGGLTHGFHGDMDKGDEAAAHDHWFHRALEFIRQMNYDGRLGEGVDLMARFADDAARASYAKVDIWPEGKMPDVQTNQCRPYLEWHLPKVLKTKAIQIIYSGGAYKGNGPDGFEVAPARRYLNAKGMTVVTMRYRTPRPLGGLAKHTTAWQDLQRAIRLVRSEASAKGLDPNRIGIMGSSAGGHLTLMGATSARHRAYCPIDKLDKLPCNVQWAVAIYPAYALTDGVDKGNVTGGNADEARLVPEFSFDLDTCPTLFIHGDADGWAAMNSVKCWEQMRRMGIQGDLHTLVKRPHCFQRKAAPGTGSYTWLDRIWEFMNHNGFNK